MGRKILADKVSDMTLFIRYLMVIQVYMDHDIGRHQVYYIP